MKNLMVFTNNDLDGAGSLILIKWLFGHNFNIDYAITTIFNLKNDYTNCDQDKYDKIFILNMTPIFELSKKVLVFTKSEKITIGIRGKVAPAITTSDLIKTFFVKSLVMTPAKNELIDLIHNFYLDGSNKKESIRLNAILNYGRNKYGPFYDRFKDGLTPYSKEEEDIFTTYKREMSDAWKKMDIYRHKVNEGIYIATASTLKFKHEFLDAMFKRYSPKMVFLVDMNNGFISVRKSPKVEIDMAGICGTLLEGRSLKNCAGGHYTDKFIKFAEKFELIDRL